MTRLEIATHLLAAEIASEHYGADLAEYTRHGASVEHAIDLAAMLIEADLARPNITKRAASSETRALDLLRDLARTRSVGLTWESSAEYEAAWRSAKEFLAELTPGTEPKK